MSKLNPDSWSVTNKTGFDVVLIDVTPNLKKPELSDFNVEKLSFLAEGVIKSGDTSHISMNKFEKSFYREVIIARAADAFPVKRVVPQVETDSHNYIPCIVTKEDFDHSQSVLESIKDFYAGKISALTSDLNAVINKTYDKNSFTQTRKDISAFLGVHYRDFDPGPIQYLDNLHMVESYLNTFPDHWIISNNENSQHKALKLFVYYAADLELTTGNKTIPPLSCTGTVSFVEPKKQLCDLKKGNNNGYQIHLDATGKGSTTLSFLKGAFIFTTDDNIKVTLKPVPMQRGVVYSGVKLKHVTEKISNDDLITVFVGKILDEIVIAIPDEIDLEKQNTGNINNTPLAPGWKLKNIGFSVLAVLLFSMSVLSCYIARKKFLKNDAITGALSVTSNESTISSIRAASDNQSVPDSGEKDLLNLIKREPVSVCAKIIGVFGINNIISELSQKKELQSALSLYEEDDDTSAKTEAQDDEIISNTLSGAGVRNELHQKYRDNINESKIRANSLLKTCAVNSAVTLASVVVESEIKHNEIINTVKPLVEEEDLNKFMEEMDLYSKMDYRTFPDNFYKLTFDLGDLDVPDDFINRCKNLIKTVDDNDRNFRESINSLISDIEKNISVESSALLATKVKIVEVRDKIKNEVERVDESSALIHEAEETIKD